MCEMNFEMRRCNRSSAYKLVYILLVAEASKRLANLPLASLHWFLRQPISCIVGFLSMSIMVCLPRLSDTSTVSVLSY